MTPPTPTFSAGNVEQSFQLLQRLRDNPPGILSDLDREHLDVIVSLIDTGVDLERSLAEKIKNIGAMRTSIAQLQAENGREKARADGMERQLAQAKAQSREADLVAEQATTAQLKGELKHATTELEDTRRRLGEQIENVKDLTSKYSVLETEKSNLARELANMEDEAHDVKRRRLTARTVFRLTEIQRQANDETCKALIEMYAGDEDDGTG